MGPDWNVYNILGNNTTFRLCILNVPSLKSKCKYKYITNTICNLNVYLVCRASGTEDLELVARLVDVLQAHLEIFSFTILYFVFVFWLMSFEYIGLKQ